MPSGDIEFSESNPLQVLVCGGGNAPHLLMGLLASRKDIRLNVYAFYHDEAERLNKGVESHNGFTLHSPSGTFVGKPNLISKDPSQVVPGSKVILLAMPAFAHELVLKNIAPFLDDNVIIGAMPAQSGFEWTLGSILGEKAKKVTAFGLQTLPWACRIKQYGVDVVMSAHKDFVHVATTPSTQVQVVSNLLGNLCAPVKFEPSSHFLNITLAPTNQIVHTGILYSMFKDWDGTPFQQPPLFYHGMTPHSAEIVGTLSNEFQQIRKAVESKMGAGRLEGVVPIHDFIVKTYPHEIQDTSTLLSSFTTNKAYDGMCAPMKMVGGYEPRVGDGFEPDFENRYLTEDVPFGLAVSKCIALLAGVSTPTIDVVLSWCQKAIGKDYVDGDKLTGADFQEVRSPQKFGINTLEELISFGEVSS